MNKLSNYLRSAVENPVMGVVSVPAEKLLEVADALEAEKALADDMYDDWRAGETVTESSSAATYRKARGM